MHELLLIGKNFIIKETHENRGTGDLWQLILPWACESGGDKCKISFNLSKRQKLEINQKYNNGWNYKG